MKIAITLCKLIDLLLFCLHCLLLLSISFVNSNLLTHIQFFSMIELARLAMGAIFHVFKHEEYNGVTSSLQKSFIYLKILSAT